MRFTYQQHLRVVEVLLDLLGSELGVVVLSCWAIVSCDEMDVVNPMQQLELTFAKKIYSAPSWHLIILKSM